jgi:hypothetical protein
MPGWAVLASASPAVAHGWGGVIGAGALLLVVVVAVVIAAKRRRL